MAGPRANSELQVKLLVQVESERAIGILEFSKNLFTRMDWRDGRSGDSYDNNNNYYYNDTFLTGKLFLLS